MADNVDITPGTGATVAADLISGALHQRMKISQGADGSATDVSSAAPLFSKLSDGTNAVAVKAASTAPAATDPALVVSISPNSVNANGQATMANSAPVAIASNQTAVPISAASASIASGAIASGAVASGAYASGSIADGAMVTLGAKADAKSTATDTTAITAMQVLKQISASVQAPPSQAVTNAGTFAVQLTPAGTGYETVAASQTGQVLGGSGAAGDYISGVLVVPATTSPGNVLLLDNATSITVFTGGAASVSNLVPFFIPLGMISVSGAWKLTTGSNVSCIGIGTFT